MKHFINIYADVCGCLSYRQPEGQHDDWITFHYCPNHVPSPSHSRAGAMVDTQDGGSPQATILSQHGAGADLPTVSPGTVFPADAGPGTKPAGTPASVGVLTGGE